MSRFSAWPLLIIALALAAELAIVADVEMPVRAIAVFGFLLIGPGMAFVRILRIGQASLEVTLAIALSLTLDALVAEGMILAHIWSAGGAVAVLVLLTVAGAVIQMLTADSGERRMLEG